MKIEKLNDDQKRIIEILACAPVKMRARDLRKRFNETRHWVRQWSAPYFYVEMALLERAGAVRGWYERCWITGYLCKVRYYRLNANKMTLTPSD